MHTVSSILIGIIVFTHAVLFLQMNQATQSVVEDAGNVTVCAEINSTTLPFQMNTTVQIFTVSLSAGI